MERVYVINCIRTLLGDRCEVSAYFGIAAFNVNGKTLHSLLRLPIKNKNMVDLKGSSLLRLQDSMQGVSYLIIDEFSVIGQRLFGCIDRRCRQLSGKQDLPFGGLNLILVGDIAQLPPVADKVIYHEHPENGIATQGYFVYKQFDTVVQLTVNQRACGNNLTQTSFRTMLTNLRNGVSTHEDWQLLLSRTPLFTSENKDLFVKLSFSNENVSTNNYESLKSLNQHIARIKAMHNNKEAEKLPADEFGGL